VHLNYFFLRQVCNSLTRQYAGKKVGQIFSQEKDELVMEFGPPGGTTYLQARLAADFSCLSFPNQFARARRNSADVFGELLGLRLSGASAFRYDRSMALDFEGGWTLVLKLHGNRSNALLWQEGECRKIFRNQLKGDIALRAEDLNRQPEPGKARFFELDGQYARFLPVLGSAVDPWFIARGYAGLSLEEKWQALQEFLGMMEKPGYYIDRDGPLPALQLYAVGGRKADFDDPLEAVTAFYRLYRQQRQMNGDRMRLQQAIVGLAKKNRAYCENTRKKLEELTGKRPFQVWADLIMANLHRIPAGSEEVELTDFYTNLPVRIRLKPGTSPQKYAETLYRKAKNQQLEIDTLSRNLEIRELQAEELEADLASLERATDPGILQALKTKYTVRRPDQQEDNKNPFREFRYMGYLILVGRNGRNNELLTFGFAKKDDLWLHAKDAPGSHVVVKQIPGSVYPKPVIEYAAGLAALFSKRRSESLCPVTYTPKKYVRKLKGGQPGQVAVEREKVILVPPADAPGDAMPPQRS
jgi:predicted ribosome quality control (RQC) complex YloA/Tae2 family protein